jgi:GNAT superfamily N-acetyltransferase
MTIVYQIDKMKTLFPTVELIQEMIDLATSATGTEQGESLYNVLARIYRDTMDIWVVTARDDASSNKLVGTFCFGDLNAFSFFSRSKGGWRDTVRDAIVAKGIDDDANVDIGCAIYVHADYNGQGIAKTMRNKRAEYQINRGVTHSLSNVAPSTSTIKSWSEAMIAKIGGEKLGTDDDGNDIYLCPHGTSL